MTMLLQIVPALVAGALLLACSNHSPVNPSGQPANPGTQPATQSSTDAQGFTIPNFTFTPARGQGFSITLPGHGTQGYAWHLVAGYNAAVAAPQGDVRYGQLPAGAGIGASAPEIYDFKATGPGQTSLTFSLYRSWEGPDRAGESRTFNVTVQ